MRLQILPEPSILSDIEHSTIVKVLSWPVNGFLFFGAAIMAGFREFVRAARCLQIKTLLKDRDEPEGPAALEFADIEFG